MSTYHAVVWMDHHEAHVLSFDREHVQAQKIRARSHHKHQGKNGQDGSFYPAISAALAGTHEVLLTGPGSARDEFRAWVDRHQPEAARLIVDSVPTDHPSDAQIVALARKYFLRYDNLASDPAAR